MSAIPQNRMLVAVLLTWVISSPEFAIAQIVDPVLESVFPPGGRAGTTVELAVSGSQLQGATTLRCAETGITFEPLEAKNSFRATLPAGTAPGLYDLRCVTPNGVSSSRLFFVGNREELLEHEPNDDMQTQAETVSLNTTVTGRIDGKGDRDHFQFIATAGQTVILECWAHRIDSMLRAVIEVYDDKGDRLAVSRGFYGVDPLIVFRVPADGTYTARIFDRVFSGSASHFYRLDIDTGPRVVFSVPSVVQAGKPSRVRLYGWNVTGATTETIAGGAEDSNAVADANVSGQPIRNATITQSSSTTFDWVDVDITPPGTIDSSLNSLRIESNQVTADGFDYHYPQSHAPLRISLTDVPVTLELPQDSTRETPIPLSVPCEVSGQLIDREEKDWYAIDAKRGEVLWLEAFGDRIESPVDLDISILDSTGQQILASFSDQVENIGRTRFPSNHLDPAGRWVAPADGRFLVVVRNLIGGLDPDPRRIYRLSIRREEPDFHLVVIPADDSPATLNVGRSGRRIADLFAFRHRGATGSIRVSALNLPDGIVCPDVWLGPGVDHAPLVLSANENAPDLTGTITLEGQLENGASRAVRSGTIVRTGTPNGSSRLTSDIPVAVRGEAPVRITADGHETRRHHLYGDLKVRYSPGCILDVAVQVERKDVSDAAPVELLGVGLPPLMENQTARIPEDKNKGYISFYLPPTLPLGTYTIAVEGRTTISVPAKGNERKPKPITVFSNPVTFEVEPAAFTVEIDPSAPKTITRGEIAQIPYTVKRKNGFISKIHTELWAPDEVIGLRARGSTSVGQSESGTLQLIANDDAPLGKQPFLRFYAVGVIEDKAVYHGSSFLDLEIVE